MEIHWRAPLQPKGFLKIIEFLIALLAIALVAGFTVDPHKDCTPASNSRNFSFHVGYPFNHVSLTIVAANGSTTSIPIRIDESLGRSHMAAAQFFITWGVFTMFYCIAAVAVYMLVTANENMAQVFDYLVYADLGGHVLWVVMWFIASTAWAASYNNMQNAVNSIVDASISNRDLQPLECTVPSNNPAYEIYRDTYVQAAIATVFGFLTMFLFAVNIFWVLIDTKLYIQWKSGRNASGSSESYAPVS